MSSGERALLSAVSAHERLVVAFSGGVDSALLAVAARKALGRDGVQAVTADSASLATGESDHCRQLTDLWDIPWTSVRTDEFADERYLENGTDRCFWCKSALMDVVEPIADAKSARVALGVNIDDFGDHRPGQKAAAERGAVFPLVEAGLTKSEVRRIAKRWEISVWDRPAMPCLSSRIPYGTSVSVDLVSKIDRAERTLRTMGFTDLRVRHYDETARIELPTAELAEAVARSAEINARLTALGYRYVTLDLAGLRSGNLNDGISHVDPT
ncbi:MAG: ATP-dependent sacrificial sulfur transferase LarE [Acidimicrobiales bacterium]|nr:ATP-dependent sacrificial sulfur transferase LarE [Acidimicrobiales bacterium]